MDLITRRVIDRLENGNVTEEVLQEYADPDYPKYDKLVEELRKELNFTSFRFNRLDDMLEAVGIEKCKMRTYCWDGKEDEWPAVQTRLSGFVSFGAHPLVKFLIL